MIIAIWGHLRYFLNDFSFFLILLGISTVLALVLFYIIYKIKISTTKKYGLLLILFTALSFVYSYSLFEAYFRYRFDQSDSLGFLRVTERWNERHVVYNNYQYRDDNFSPDKPPGTVRIGVMGDSNTFGYGIKNVNDRFSNQLEQDLLKNGYKTQVYNFGVPGFDTEQEVKEYNRVAKLNFDIVVWGYFLNDIEEATRSAGGAALRIAQKPSPSRLVNYLIDQSYFFDYIYWRLGSRYTNTFVAVRNADLDQYAIPEIFNHHTALIDEFTNRLETDGKKIVALVMPFFYFIPNYPQEAVAIHQKMDGVFASDGAVVVDMLPYVKDKKGKDLIVSPYDSHPNEYVHKLMADKLYDAIVPLLTKTPEGTIVKK